MAREFLKVFHELTYRWRPIEIWQDFIVMTACAISNSIDKLNYEGREKTYMRIITKYNEKERMLFPELVAAIVDELERNPNQDLLGRLYMELELGNKNTGQFFTPYCVCEAMAEISSDKLINDIEEKGYVTVNDPACGAGATLIAEIHSIERKLKDTNLNWQNHVLVYAQDIDYSVAMMCYIQLSLLGVAAYIKIGDTLSDPITNKESLKNIWTTPMLKSPIWTMRRIIHFGTR